MKVSVGEVVRAANGDHLPADLILLSSRSGTAPVCMWVLWEGGAQVERICYSNILLSPFFFLFLFIFFFAVCFLFLSAFDVIPSYAIFIFSHALIDIVGF